MTSWERILQTMERRVNPHSFSTWFRPTRQESAENGKLIVRVPKPAFRKRLTETYGELLQAVLAELGMSGTQLEFLPAEAEPPPLSATAALSATGKAASDAAAESRGEKCPALPDAAWYGLSGEYRGISGPCTEASHSYHYACFVSAVGACMGRSVYFERAGRHYPNLYIVLVGPSGGARKSTALRFGLDLVEAIDSKIAIAWTLDSREGFLQDLDELGKSRAHNSGVTAILRLEELRSLIDKASMEGLRNIVPLLAHAYDCPRSLQVRTRKNPVTVVKPTLSLVAATTWDWLQGIRSPDLLGGLGNRMMWVSGEPGAAIPAPPRPDGERLDTIVRELRRCIAYWRRKGTSEFSFNPSAAKLWETIYGELYGHRNEDPLIANLGERLQNHCLKIALIFAALDRRPIIERHHLEAAYAFTQFLYEGLWYLFRGFGMSPMGQLDEKIIEAVKREGPNGTRLPKLKKRLWRTDMETFNRRLFHLCQPDGPLRRITDGQKVIIVAAEE
jgi:putative DNA primase/helicase